MRLVISLIVAALLLSGCGPKPQSTHEIQAAEDTRKAQQKAIEERRQREQATRYLEEALGAVVTRTKKPEYHQRSRQAAQQRLGP